MKYLNNGHELNERQFVNRLNADKTAKIRALRKKISIEKGGFVLL